MPTIDYILNTTGDCTNNSSGAFNINMFGGSPAYTLIWETPSSLAGTFEDFGVGNNSPVYGLGSLSAGTYSFFVKDSSPYNNGVLVTFYISSGTCVSFTKQNTICGLNNGSITAQTQNFYSNASFYLYNLNGLVSSAVNILNNQFIFNSLSAGTYYVIANDGGGCTGKTESCVIKSSTTFDYGFYIIDQTPCNSDPPGTGFGKVYITGLTGSAPYTYLWNNGETTSSLIDLTNGSYSVTVTDSTGCAVTKTAQVGLVSPPGVGSVQVLQQPSCFNSDGQVKVIITGGTSPYYISGSTGESDTILTNNYTFTNVPAGIFYFMVTDAGLCKFISNVTLFSPRSFNIVSIRTTNSNCNDFGGRIDVIINGGTPVFTYELTDSLGDTQTQVTNSPSVQFNNLTSGIYTLTISDAGGCDYTNTYVINNTPLFNLELYTTGTTCGQENGAVKLEVSGTSGPFQYQLTGENIITGSFSSYTYTGLSYGTYTASVTELSSGNRCNVSENVLVASSTTVGFELYPIDTVLGSDGEIWVFVTAGTPTFTYNWSSNVNGQTSSHVTGLTAGTYSLTVTDISGCSQTGTVIIGGKNRYTSTNYFISCENTFTESGVIQKGPQQMLLEGYKDLTSGDTNCILNFAIFTLETIVSGESKTSEFFTANTLSEYPTEFQLINEVTSLIESYDYIDEVKIDLINNTINIKTDCNPNFPLSDVGVEVDLSIDYDISCESCGFIGGIILNSFDIECDCDDGGCIRGNFEYSAITNYSVTGGSGSYMLMYSGASGWFNLYPFAGLSPNGTTTTTIPNILNGTNLNDTYNFKIIDTVYGYESNVISDNVIGCISFITLWRTSNTDGTSTVSGDLQLPLISTGTYNFTVYWGDGNSDTITTWNDPLTLHTYASPDDYIVKIVGQIEGFKFSGSSNNDKVKLLHVNRWGQVLLGNDGAYFKGANNLTLSGTVDYPSLSGTTNLDEMFMNCTSLVTINNPSLWDLSNVTSMNDMFRGATSFNQNINSWNISGVTGMSGTFRSATSFNQPLNSWDTFNVINLDETFRDASSFNKNINSWNISGVTTMVGTFQSAIDFNQPLSGWNVSNVTDMSRTFFGAEDFDQSINNWNVSNVTTMYRMFRAATSFNQPLNSWHNKTSGVTNMNEMFTGAKVFNQAIGFWNTSNVTGMSQMFFSAEDFDQNLNLWITSAVTDMDGMFRNTPFNQPLNNWDVSNVTDMSYMFYSAQLFDQNINSWSTSAVTDMSYMFVSAGTFNNPLNNWDVSNVTGMSYMFESAKLFDQPLNSWDVSSVTSFEEMFRNAEDFDQDIGSWIINNIASTSFYGMFISAATFNNGGSPSISGWSVSAITSPNMSYMFSASTQFNQDLSNWCVVNIPTKPIGFDTGTNNWAGGTSTRPQWGNPC